MSDVINYAACVTVDGKSTPIEMLSDEQVRLALDKAVKAGVRVRNEIVAFARRLVPLTSEVSIDVEDKALSYLPKFGAFVDIAEHNIMTAILGDGPSDRWAEGAEATSPIPERTEFAAMPDYDNMPTKW